MGEVREGARYVRSDALKVGFRVVPAAEGSFLCYVGACECWGFTNVTDLMTWLQRAAQAQRAADVEPLTEAQVVGREPDGFVEVPRGTMASWPAEVPSGRTMRTTALGSLADRVAQQETSAAVQNMHKGMMNTPEPKGAA